MNPRNFFAELKRRNVYKVAVAYAVAGWLVMHIACTVVPALHLPDAIRRRAESTMEKEKILQKCAKSCLTG